MNGCGEFDCFSIDNQEYYIDDISLGFYSITVLDGIGYTFDVSFSILENDLIEPFIWEDGEGLSTYNIRVDLSMVLYGANVIFRNKL